MFEVVSLGGKGNEETRRKSMRGYVNAIPLCRHSGIEVWRFFLRHIGECI
jgi:hypothetical protein